MSSRGLRPAGISYVERLERSSCSLSSSERIPTNTLFAKQLILGNLAIMNLNGAINSALEKIFGYRLVRSNLKSATDRLFSMLKTEGFNPQAVLDVGANHGDWTRTAIKYFPESIYTLVEPQDHLKSSVADLIKRGYQINWINAGAGIETGEQWFTVADRDDSSSFLVSGAETTHVKRIRMNVVTLNQLVKESGIIPDLVKIDAEGWDLKVLDGASSLFGVTDVILVEAAVCARNLDNTMLAVLNKLDRLGYQILDITDLNRSPSSGALWLVELAFLRRGSLISNLGFTTY